MKSVVNYDNYIMRWCGVEWYMKRKYHITVILLLVLVISLVFINWNVMLVKAEDSKDLTALINS